MPEITGPQPGYGNIAAYLYDLGLIIDHLVENPTDWRWWFTTPFGNFLDWIGIGAGRPKLGPDSATEQIAQFLGASHNPVAVWYGIGVRVLEAQGFPISVSHGPGRQHYDRLAKAFSQDLDRQWIAKSISSQYFRQWQRAIQSLKTNIGQIILSGQNRAYENAVDIGLINPKTGYPNPSCSTAAIIDQCLDVCTGDHVNPFACAACIAAACKGAPKNMACSNTHEVTSRVQGPGTCCAALAKSGQTPHVGLRVAATDRKGRCFVCEVKQGKKGLAFKRGKSAGICPTATGGCCALTAASGAAGSPAFG